MSGESILIVDDNPLNTKLAFLLLKTEGYDIRTAVDAEQALALLQSYQPRLILMDIQLPGMDGLALTRVLKADPKRKDIIILAVTSYAMKGDEDKALEAGCDGYVTKPIDLQALLALVRKHLDK
jgi:CheY-like chemotaxis protein